MAIGDQGQGNLAAHELMLTQLYAMCLEHVSDPQDWLIGNARELARDIARSEVLSSEAKNAAWGSVRRVLEETSWRLEAGGRGNAIDLRTPRSVAGAPVKRRIVSAAGKAREASKVDVRGIFGSRHRGSVRYGSGRVEGART